MARRLFDLTGQAGSLTLMKEAIMEDFLARRYPTMFGSQRGPQWATPSPSPRSRSRIQTGQPATPATAYFPMRPTMSVNGESVRFVPVGDFARAIGRSVSHVRLLEAQGVLPKARGRRLVAIGPDGRKNPGWRMYDARFVEAARVIAAEERIPQRTRVTDMSSFKARIWAAHHALHPATAPAPQG